MRVLDECNAVKLVLSLSLFMYSGPALSNYASEAALFDIFGAAFRLCAVLAMEDICCVCPYLGRLPHYCLPNDKACID